MTRTHPLRTRGATAMLAACIAALAAFTLPARAEAEPPVMLITSVDGGWGFRGPIAARFDRELDVEGSTATLTNSKAQEITGAVTITRSTGPDRDAIVFTPAPLEGDVQLSEALSNYTIVFTAKAKEGGTVATATKTFKLDMTPPLAQISTPVDGTLLLQDATTTLTGSASDPRSDKDGVYRSGVVAVEVQFYNLLKNLSTSGNSEMRELRQYPLLADCTPATCPSAGDKSWAADASKLTTGRWTIKVFAIDLAGNKSSVAQVTITKL